MALSERQMAKAVAAIEKEKANEDWADRMAAEVLFYLESNKNDPIAQKRIIANHLREAASRKP